MIRWKGALPVPVSNRLMHDEVTGLRIEPVSAVHPFVQQGGVVEKRDPGARSFVLRNNDGFGGLDLRQHRGVQGSVS